MYGKLGERQYLIRNSQNLTSESGARKFIRTYAQCGEQIRFEEKKHPHSLIFLAADDNGFYTLQYYGKNGNPFLSYWTYKNFASISNSKGKYGCQVFMIM